MKRTHPLAWAAAAAPWVCAVVYLAVIASGVAGNACDRISPVAVVAGLGTALGPVLGIAALIAIAVGKNERGGKVLAVSGVAFGVLFFVVCVGLIFFCGMGPAMKG
jgi:hypothetical protein